MKKVLTTLTLLLTLCPFVFGQTGSYHWTPNLSGYDNDLLLTSIVMIDGDMVETEGVGTYEIGAFCEGECRGTEKISLEIIKNQPYYLVFLFIAGDKGDVVTFRIYDHNNGRELNYQCTTEIKLTKDGIVGTYLDPKPIEFYSVAETNGVKFDNLQEAVNAAQIGGTVTLTNNSTGSGAVIDKDITIDFNEKTYTITEGNSIEIAEDGVLTVAAEGGMNLEGEGKLVINGGQLYHNIAGINATVKKTFTPQTEQFYWNTISAPIVGGAAIPTNATYDHDLYRYDEVEQEWEYYLDADEVGFSTLELGRGYLYAAGDDDITVELNGVLNVADVEFPLSYTEGNELAGFNMIGNPFTHNINDSHFSGATLSEGYYVIGENGEWLSRYDGADDIEPMQSVLVKTSEEANVTIKKQAADTRNVSNGSLRIDVTGSNCQDVAYVSFNEGIGLDKISHNNSTSALLYITNDGKDYAVATMSKDVTEIPVSFKAMTMGEYTISVTAQNCEFETLYLIDRLTGKKVNLNMESYSFVATSNDNPNRFVLTTTETLGIEDNKAEAFVYINNDEIIINNIQGHAQLNIIDMMGRQAASYDVFESAVISTSSLERGVYLIQMTDVNGIRTQKILVD